MVALAIVGRTVSEYSGCYSASSLPRRKWTGEIITGGATLGYS
ncbi:hypothetical protein ACWDTI_10700 [Gordonia sp. NPDC003424]